MRTTTPQATPEATATAGKVLVPLNTVGAGGGYEAVGAGHDTTSYWVVYHDKWHTNARNYAVVVRVLGGLPAHLAWAGKLFPKPAPTPTGGSPVTIVGPTLTPADVRAVHDGLASIPRSAFFALARGAQAMNRPLSAPHMTAPLVVAIGGSPASGFTYTVVQPTGIAFEQIPLRASSSASQLVGCGPSDGNTWGIVIGFSTSTRTLSIIEDGRRVVTSRPAQDPLVPSMRLFGLKLPDTVEHLTVVVNGTEKDNVGLSLCPQP